jgi:two-component system sensor histidine kinase YesM
MKLIRVHSLKSKIILIFLVIAIIVLMLQAVFQTLISTIIMQQSNAFFQETVHQIGKRVDLQMKQSENMALAITENQVLINYLKDLKNNNINYSIAKYKITREVLRLTNLEMIDNIYIFPIRHPPINSYFSAAIIETDPSMRKLLDSAATDKLIQSITFHPKLLQVSILLSIQEQNERLGLLRIDFNKTFLSNILDEAKLGKEGEVYLIGDNSIIFARNHNLIGKPPSVINDIPGTAVQQTLQHNDWKLVGVVPKSELVNHIDQFNNIFMLMVCLILLSILAFALATARIILRPLKTIMKGMASIQQGNLNIMLDINRKDEFSTIIHSFNDMAERVKTLVGTIYRQQVHYRKAEMLSLQSKLNPHFLYNTLDMIYWRLILRDEEEIGELIVSLSSILRYSITHHNEFVTVREDMGQIECYLKLQMTRYEDKLRYAFAIPEEVMEIKVPKLIIQPLVENSLKYAFQDMKRDGSIVIRSYLDNDDLFFEVSDNGVGIPDEKLRSIHASMEALSNEAGIGIQLVHQRAKYIYGEAYGVSVETEAGKGTSITVKIKKKAEILAEELMGG